jgi:hypothetical protein
MPFFLIPLLLGGLVGGGAGFVLGDGVDGSSRVVKWAVIGGIAYAVYSSGVLAKGRG